MCERKNKLAEVKETKRPFVDITNESDSAVLLVDAAGEESSVYNEDLACDK